MKTDYDICVIGGGAAGLVVAAGASSLGAKVILIEKHRLGGDCLYTGCVPSKAMLHIASLADSARRASALGMFTADVCPDLASARQYIKEVIQSIEPHDSPERFRGLGVEVVFGNARFRDHRTLEIDGKSVSARHFVLATGSRPFIPAVPGLDKIPYFTNETVFETKEEFSHLVIIGGGAVGVELAQAHQRLGVKVTLVHRAAQILPQEDGSLAQCVHDQLVADGVNIILNSSLNSANQSGAILELTLESRDGSTIILEASHLLLATGRRPNLEELALANAGVEVVNGALLLNDRLRTTNKRIYACGDVAGPYLFTHMAEHQAGIVLRNTLFRMRARQEKEVVPWCTFTSPELARVGLNEQDAQEQNIPCSIHEFQFSEIDRNRTDNDLLGKIRVLADKKGRVLGAGIVGNGAGELIHEYALAMKKRVTLGELTGLIHVYPTRSQINRRVADQYLKSRLTPSTKKWIKRIFCLRGN